MNNLSLNYNILLLIIIYNTAWNIYNVNYIFIIILYTTEHFSWMRHIYDLYCFNLYYMPSWKIGTIVTILQTKKLRLGVQVLTWHPHPDLLRSEVHAFHAVSWPHRGAINSPSFQKWALIIAVSPTHPSTVANLWHHAGGSTTPWTTGTVSEPVLRWSKDW